MRRLPSSLVFFVLAGPAALQAQAADPEVGGATFLLVPVGTRAVSLGQAAVADGGTSEAAFWNPAGLARMARSEISLHHASTFASDNTVLSGYVAANRLGVLGASAYVVDFGSQEVVTGTGQPIGRLSPKNIEILASYATTVAGDLSFGINYKLIQLRNDCSGDCGPIRSVTGTTHGVDVGLQYGVGTANNLRIGVALQHAGFDLQVQNRDQADPLPTRLQIGVAYRIFLPPPAGLDEGLDARLLVDVQNAVRDLGDPDARVGIDIGFAEILRVRAGYAFLDAESRGPSVGLGLQIGRVGVDFARSFSWPPDSTNRPT